MKNRNNIFNQPVKSDLKLVRQVFLKIFLEEQSQFNPTPRPYISIVKQPIKKRLNVK